MALRAGIAIRFDAPHREQQTLSVASRWDDDEDGDAQDGRSGVAAAASVAAAARASAELDGEELDGEPLDAAEAMPPAALAAMEAVLPKEARRQLEVKVMEHADRLEG